MTEQYANCMPSTIPQEIGKFWRVPGVICAAPSIYWTFSRIRLSDRDVWHERHIGVGLYAILWDPLSCPTASSIFRGVQPTTLLLSSPATPHHSHRVSSVEARVCQTYSDRGHKSGWGPSVASLRRQKQCHSASNSHRQREDSHRVGHLYLSPLVSDHRCVEQWTVRHPLCRTYQNLQNL